MADDKTVEQTRERMKDLLRMIAEQHDATQEHLERLTEQRAQLVAAATALGLSRSAVGRELGISPQRVQQILDRAGSARPSTSAEAVKRLQDMARDVARDVAKRRS